MSEANQTPAEIAAAAAQARVVTCLAAGRNFRLEAGAGAGKTYSLIDALKRLIAERGTALLRNDQRIACITYTQVATNEIVSEIGEHPAIYVNTIHAFCWSVMSRFQSHLRALIPKIDRYREKIAEVGGLGNRTVEYNLGFFGIEDDKVTLFHDDIPYLMAKLLDNEKFRAILTNAYPIVFIDEYQDTDEHFLDAVAKNFFSTGKGPLVGLFGDHWQTIFRNHYTLTQFPEVEGIDKGSNFRSVPAVVNVLNNLRPELVQAVSDPAAVGEARVFHTNAYAGQRVSSQSGKNDLSSTVAHDYLEGLRTRLTAEGWDFSPSSTKILMLTHNVLAAEQGYPMIADIFPRKESFAKKEDKLIEFLVDIVEPMCRAYQNKRYGQMFQVLGRAQSIRSHADKEAWSKDMTTLIELRSKGTIGDVLDHLKATRRPRIPDSITRRQDELAKLGTEPAVDEPSTVTRLRQLKLVPYQEIIMLTKFIEGLTPFATQHSVKGAEFENVLVVLGGGWNHYNWPQLLELLHTGAVTAKNEKAYYRARNLLYVALSRPKKRLAVLVTQTLSADALSTLCHLFGDTNVESYVL